MIKLTHKLTQTQAYTNTSLHTYQLTHIPAYTNNLAACCATSVRVRYSINVPVGQMTTGALNNTAVYVCMLQAAVSHANLP